MKDEPCAYPSPAFKLSPQGRSIPIRPIAPAVCYNSVSLATLTADARGIIGLTSV